MLTKQEDLEKCAINFYRELFSAQQELEQEEILALVLGKVTPEMNLDLTKPYTEEEVKQALFMMGPDKSPGPNGFTAGFYQTHWDLVGPSVTQAVLNFLNGGTLPDGINHTTIVLIPKIKNPLDMKHFRPISLCNVIYKI